MSTEPEQASSQIGTLNEKPLHAALKEWYEEPNDVFEVSLDGYFIDVVRDDLLIEIQTKNFSAMKRKLLDLTTRHRVRLVHPIAEQKWIVKLAKGRAGKESRRKSPKRGTAEQLFEELVAFPKLMANRNFSLEVLLIHEEEVRRHDPKRGWRRKGWVTEERRLVKVVEHRVFSSPDEMRVFIPPELSEPFTTSELAAALDRPRRLAQMMAYCLREMGAITADGKRGNAILYIRD
jgi:hypothetical protein